MIKPHSSVWALSIGLAFSVDQISTASAQSIHSPFGSAFGRAIPTPEGAQDLGKRSGSEPIDVSITLNRNHEAELEQLLSEQQTPGSPAYRRFLTSEEFDQDFAPTPDQIEFVTGSLKEGGFQIVKISTDRTVVTASAPSGVAENFFRTEIHSIRQKDGKMRYANAAPLVIPANIAPMVKGVRLHNLVIAHTFLHRGIHSVQETGTAKPDTLGSPYYHNSYCCWRYIVHV
jgi:pro-kumamolisin-like protein